MIKFKFEITGNIDKGNIHLIISNEIKKLDECFVDWEIGSNYCQNFISACSKILDMSEDNVGMNLYSMSDHCELMNALNIECIKFLDDCCTKENPLDLSSINHGHIGYDRQDLLCKTGWYILKFKVYNPAISYEPIKVDVLNITIAKNGNVQLIYAKNEDDEMQDFYYNGNEHAWKPLTIGLDIEHSLKSWDTEFGVPVPNDMKDSIKNDKFGWKIYK